jgi:hypothetical protein
VSKHNIGKNWSQEDASIKLEIKPLRDYKTAFCSPQAHTVPIVKKLLPPPEVEVMQSFDKCMCMKPCAHINSKNTVCTLKFFLKMFILAQARSLLILLWIHGDLHDKRSENIILACYKFIIFYR